MPPEPSAQRPSAAVRTRAEIEALSPDDRFGIYCRVMREVAEVFIKHESYIVRVWDGLDGCWTDCTGEVGCDEALRVWLERTEGGTRQVSYADIDYYKIFPSDTRMHFDGAEERGMHR
jgi:hypothetical protein